MPDSTAAAPDSLTLESTAGDSAEAAPLRIGAISVTGNVLTDSARIVRSFEVLPGSRYTDEAVRRGIRKLFALGLFNDVNVLRHERDGEVDLVIQVVERPRISKITFSGNKKKETSELEKKLSVHVGEVYSPTVVQTQVDSLLRFYREEGYARAQVDARMDTTSQANQVALHFEIREGDKVRIALIEFGGVHAFDAKRLRKQLKTKTHGFFGGGEVKDENFSEDKDKLEAYYHDHGYRDMRMLDESLKPGGDSRHLTLSITVDEGIRYRMGTIAWSGNTVVPQADLARLWPKKGGDTYDASRIERVQGLAYAEYAEKGYLYVGVEPREGVRDSNVVDVTYAITEGQPSNVRYVSVIGNRVTREHVIRREIDLHEGDRFRRSALVRTRDDLMRLGLFEEVSPDFSAAESTDVDINIKVKEKQVGTASAGAGYSGDLGLTGFLELGHNNVLGNGQSLSLHLERGSKKSDYFLSFTEPWFHSSPTLLGFSAFNTSTDLDVYTEKRRGGSAKIGRPLRWPDYSRGAIEYRLEDVTISQPTGSLTVSDSVALSGIPVGRPVRTSSMNLSFSRNSADNPFYPTKGTRLTLSDELAGGLFGGAVNYHKHRIEGRAYFPSFLKGVTTMLRARVGILGRYSGQHFDVPAYERFRLGGGSIADPLRGYDDYQVVPEKFIHDVFTRTGVIDHIDSTTTPGVKDTVFQVVKQRVRYPGGKWMTLYTVEQQFPIVAPLHGVVFFDAGNTWDQFRDIQPFRLKVGAGIGFRIDIPLLGTIGFDYGYGFNRDDGPRGKGHFLLGNVNF